MSDTIELDGDMTADVSVYLGRDVALEVEGGDSRTTAFMSPAEAVRLSRALVKAAAEALGVEV